MKIITFIYIFLLYILLTPGILINKNYYILSALLYTLIIHFTLERINLSVESLQASTVNNSLNVQFHNIVDDSNHNDAEIAEHLVNAYSELQDIKNNIVMLNKRLNDIYRVDNFEVLSDYYNKVLATYENYKERYEKYISMETKINDKQLEINKLKLDEKKSKRENEKCHLKSKVQENKVFKNKVITGKIQSRITSTQNQIDSINEDIAEMEEKIPQLESYLKSKKNICKIMSNPIVIYDKPVTIKNPNEFTTSFDLDAPIYVMKVVIGTDWWNKRPINITINAGGIELATKTVNFYENSNCGVKGNQLCNSSTNTIAQIVIPVNNTDLLVKNINVKASGFMNSSEFYIQYIKVYY